MSNMLSLQVRVFYVVIGAMLLSVAVAQDFEPGPLEPDPQPVTTTTVTPIVTATDSPFTTTTTTTTPWTTTTTTPAPTTTTTPESTTTTTTTTTPEPTTTRTPTTTTEPTTTPEPFTTVPDTSRPWTGYPYNPWLPFYPTTKPPYYNHHHYHKNCYYREQRGSPYFKWSCGRLHYEYPKYCYYCCLYSTSAYAGCTQVEHSRCSSYHYPYSYAYLR